ncbi:hypothetical protein HZ326_5154 [Fusarium oxysporum f. sp. albedinis]|nr:hypothetical protein HZ326_5154 [Fusarium oxysporum f. sp. albedinis]
MNVCRCQCQCECPERVPCSETIAHRGACIVKLVCGLASSVRWRWAWSTQGSFANRPMTSSINIIALSKRQRH